MAHAALHDAYQRGPVALAWPALLGFVRLATRSGILPRPLEVEQAMDVVHAWTDHPAAVLVHPGAQHEGLLRRLLVALGIGGPIVSDAHFAALAIENAATLMSFDRDFERFAGLRFKRLA
ncbi:MAG: PIN domain-containing protein [Rubrivivax sp.]|nr:PIN domain-containing protein [Rubrivivax sp.]